LGTLKRVVVLLAVAGLLWAGWTVAGKVRHNRHVAHEIALVADASSEHDISMSVAIGGMTMPDVPIAESYNASGTLRIMNQDLSPMMTSAALKELQVHVVEPLVFTDYTTIGGWPAGTVPSGKTQGTDGFVYRADFWPPMPPFWTVVGPNPQWIWVGNDTGWEGSIDWSITATHSHIDRVETQNVHMGSDVGPTHSSERGFADTWEVTSSGAEVVITFGAMTATATDASEIPSPSVSVTITATMHKSVGGQTVVYAQFADLQASNIDLVLDGIYKKYSGQEYYLIGRGSGIDVETRDYYGVGTFIISGSFSPPHICDWSKMGIGIWGGYAP